MTKSQAIIERLFEFPKKLNSLLDEEKYEQFQQQQALFGDLLKDFINKHSESELSSFIEQLKQLKSMIKLTQDRAEENSKKLKEKSLSLQRNKKKIQAYK